MRSEEHKIDRLDRQNAEPHIFQSGYFAKIDSSYKKREDRSFKPRYDVSKTPSITFDDVNLAKNGQ